MIYAATALSRLDVSVGLADVAREERYTRPVVQTGTDFVIKVCSGVLLVGAFSLE